MGTIDTIDQARSVAFRPGPGHSRSSHAKRFARAAKTIWRVLDNLLERRRSRLALLEMTDEQLKDIGISRRDADREGRRSFWD